MGYKTAVQLGFEEKMKAALESRDWHEVIGLNVAYGAALLLTEPGRVVDQLVTSYAYIDSVNSREIEDTEMFSSVSTDDDEDIED